jgi:hypothetical protein
MLDSRYLLVEIFKPGAKLVVRSYPVSPRPAVGSPPTMVSQSLAKSPVSKLNPHLVHISHQVKLTAQMMSTEAGLHADPARRHVRKARRDLSS